MSTSAVRINTPPNLDGTSSGTAHSRLCRTENCVHRVTHRTRDRGVVLRQHCERLLQTGKLAVPNDTVLLAGTGEQNTVPSSRPQLITTRRTYTCSHHSQATSNEKRATQMTTSLGRTYINFERVRHLQRGKTSSHNTIRAQCRLADGRPIGFPTCLPHWLVQLY